MVTLTKKGKKVTVTPIVTDTRKLNKANLITIFRQCLDNDMPFGVEFVKESNGETKGAIICAYKGSPTTAKGLVLVKDLNIAYGFTKHSNGQDSPFTNVAVRNVTKVIMDGVEYYRA